MEKCACKGFFLERFIQPAILMHLAAGSHHGFSLLKKLLTKVISPAKAPLTPPGLPHFKKMEGAGLLVSKWDTESAAQPRKIYEITDDGRSCLANWETTLYNYRDSIDELAKSISLVLKSEDIASCQCKCGKK